MHPLPVQQAVPLRAVPPVAAGVELRATRGRPERAATRERVASAEELAAEEAWLAAEDGAVVAASVVAEDRLELEASLAQEEWESAASVARLERVLVALLVGVVPPELAPVARRSACRTPSARLVFFVATRSAA